MESYLFNSRQTIDKAVASFSRSSKPSRNRKKTLRIREEHAAANSTNISHQSRKLNRLRIESFGVSQRMKERRQEPKCFL